VNSQVILEVSISLLYSPMTRILSSAFLSLLLFLCTGYASGQDVILKLKSDGNTPQTRDYTFKQVIDSRAQKSIGQIYDPQRNKHPASFADNLPQEILGFYNARINSTKNPYYKFLVKVYKLDLKEIYHPDLKGYRGDIQLSLGFFLIGENEPVHLVDFTSKVQYGRPGTQMHYVESSIHKLFESSWEYFDSWLSTQYLTNRSLVKKVRLNIIDPIRESSKDTVFYDPKRPLTWADFTETPNPRSSYNATIFSSISIEGNANIENGEIVQVISVKVYMLPEQSWVKDASEYANNHEQRHFDLTRIAANRMIIRLKNVELEPFLFEATLNDIYLDAYREMNRLQELYDSQTRNGMNSEKQADWNQIIRKALAGDMETLDKFLDRE